MKSEEVSNLWNEIEGRDLDGKLDDKVKTGIRALLSEKGALAVNKMASALMVTDFPRNLETVEKFLQQVERAVSRQVIIEAKILEVTLNDRFQLGIDWRFLPQMTNAGFGWTSEPELDRCHQYHFLPVGGPGCHHRADGGHRHPQFYQYARCPFPAGARERHLSSSRSTSQNEKSIIKAATEEVYFEVSIATSTGAAPIITADSPECDHRRDPERDAPDRRRREYPSQIQPSVTEEVTRRTRAGGGLRRERPDRDRGPGGFGQAGPDRGAGQGRADDRDRRIDQRA